MSTVEKAPKLTRSLPIDLDEIARMSPEERAELALPDHTQLPDHDGSIVENFQEDPQTILLTDSILPVLQRLHPDGDFLIGRDCGIYWRVTDPPLRGVKCPDWFYVPGVPRSPAGTFKRSYVLWQEWIPPLILLEIVSGDGSVERDRTPYEGKFWVYEKVIGSKYYGIYDAYPGHIEMYHRVENRFERLPANERGRYPIAEMGVELGLWRGEFLGWDVEWMRWFDAEGNLILTGHETARIEADRLLRETNRAEHEAERAAREAERAQQEAERAAREADRAERLAAQLRALGIEPEA
jgi:Uma2 family endonuclease